MSCPRTFSTNGVVPSGKYSRTCLTFRNFHLTADIHIMDTTSSAREMFRVVCFSRASTSASASSNDNPPALNHSTKPSAFVRRQRPAHVDDSSKSTTPQYGLSATLLLPRFCQELRSAISLVRCNPNANAPVKTTKNMTAPNPKRAP